MQQPIPEIKIRSKIDALIYSRINTAVYYR